MRRWRTSTLIIVGWTLVMGALTGVAYVNGAYPEVIATVWAIVVVPLGLIWYVRRPGVTKPRVAVAIAVAFILLLGLTFLRPAVPT
jgi:hypothetical protein